MAANQLGVRIMISVCLYDGHLAIEEPDTTMAIWQPFEDSPRARFGPDWVRPMVTTGPNSLKHDAEMLPLNWVLA